MTMYSACRLLLISFRLRFPHPKYVCLDCGHEDALNHDGYCTFCTQKLDPERGLSLTPIQNSLRKERGKNLKLVLQFDPDPIQSRWAQYQEKATDKVELEENQVNIQVAKLLLARDYVNIRRRQLAEQLGAQVLAGAV